VFAVVKHEQQVPFSQGAENRIYDWPPRLFSHSEHTRQLIRDQARFCQRSQFHQPDTARILLQNHSGYFQGQACLTAATAAD
jgi:hypothetical protein